MNSPRTKELKRSRFNFAHNHPTELSNGKVYFIWIFFSAECTFSLSVKENWQNSRIWSTERPNILYETIHNYQSIMAWCAISKSGVIGPYFLENENVTGSTCKRISHYFLFLKLQNHPENLIFHQDGPPPQYSLELREYLDWKCPNQWIGRRGPILWLSNSPDLIPRDFFCDKIKDKVCRDPRQSFYELKNRIREACAWRSQASF